MGGLSLDEIKAEVWGRFGETQRVYLGTAEADQPRVRPVTLLNLDERLWIATSIRSGKTRQVRRNPNVEFCLPIHEEAGDGYVRVAGIASIVTEPATKESVGGRIPFLSQYWDGVDDPGFCLIRITRVEIEYLRPGDDDATTFIVRSQAPRITGCADVPDADPGPP